MTVLSRSKKAARMVSATHQQPLDGVFGIGGDQHQHFVGNGQPGVAPGHDQVIAAHHGDHAWRHRGVTEVGELTTAGGRRCRRPG